jgi:glutamate-1-semialdehyde 2,1-aminomutase
MINNKIVIGLAQSDKNYGLSKNNNLKNINIILEKFKINKLDTAPGYKYSNRIISNIKKKKNIKIISKLPSIYCPKNDLKKQVKLILEKIFSDNGISKLEGILLHDPLQPLDEERWKIIYKVLKNFQSKGLISKIGVSVYNKLELINILSVFTPDIIQFPYNVFNQEFNDKNFLRYLKKKKIKLQARSIFLQGLLCQKTNKISKYFYNWKQQLIKWKNFLKRKKITSAEACLTFAFQNNYIDEFIISGENNNQIIKNLNLIKGINLDSPLNFDELSCKDERLIDPRYWKKKLSLDKNYYLWEDAKNYILNGGMLLSKRQEQLLPGKWPVFFKKAKKCFIWDINNKKYLDYSLMGVGTNILGYANDQVNKKLKKTIIESNISTLNSKEDLLLSQKLISLHPWSSQCFFARSGGEANAIAVRISRAYTRKDEVAICGYHGWHDWYLSTNLDNKKNLDKIFLPGISTLGVPNKISGLTHPFKYNDINGIKDLIKKNKNIGTIFMEVERNEKPKNNFLKKIRDIANKNNIVLIFDECTSGFRETFGGLHKKYNINPDIVVFGKSLGNGIPITAVLGKKNIMEKAKESFVSSTFWTDRLGPTAGVATLEAMEKIKSWEIITNLGKRIKKEWFKIAKKYKIKIKITGLDAMPLFKFVSKKDIYYRNYITQEMLKKNILCTNYVYCSINHTKYLKRYLNELDKIFKKISKYENGLSILNDLENPISKNNFSRLN